MIADTLTVIKGSAIGGIIVAGVASGSDTSAITVAIIGAVGLVTAGAIGAYFNRRTARDSVSAAAVYADLQRANSENGELREKLEASTRREEALTRLLLQHGIPVIE